MELHEIKYIFVEYGDSNRMYKAETDMFPEID